MSPITDNKQGMRVLIAGSILQLFLGIIYVWSVFVRPVSEVYLWDINSVKLTSSFMLCFFVVGILAGGKLLLKIGAEKVVLIGGLMLAAGMFITSFLPQGLAWLMYVSYGIIGGFGVGAGYNTVNTAVQKSFPQNRGLATGVSVCAFGFSTVIFAPLVEKLIALFGLRNSFMILAVVFFVAVLVLFRFIRLPDEATQTGSAAAELMAKRQYTTSETIKTRNFYLITLSLMFGDAAFFILNPSFKSLAADRGLGDSIGTALVMIIGVASALGRLCAPLLSDKMGRERALLTILVANTVCTFMLCFVNSALFMVVIVIIAFYYGGAAGIYPVLTADYFGIRNVGSNYGAVMVGFMVSTLVFPLFLTPVNNIVLKFIILGVVAALGSALIIILMFGKKEEPARP